MEPVAGEPERPGEDGFCRLALPGSCPWEDDDEPLGLGGIKPKSSPIPRRRSSESSCSDDDSQPPPSSSRRVSFADAFGRSLVSVKQFDSWAVCDPSVPLEKDPNKEKDHFLSLLFTLPRSSEELLWRVRQQKVELESLELLPGTTTLKGIIRVLNLCFDKLVFIRMSLDCWNSHFDLLAEYVPGLSDGDTDSFSFKLTLVPPFGRQGARVDFCLRYDTPFGNFWANNNGQNYVLFCYEKAKGQGENEGKHKRKGCLKSTSLGSSSETSSTSSADTIPEILLNCGMAVNTEPGQKERMQEKCIKLQEENSRNRNRRTKRRAEQLAKVQQYFAQREDKDLNQTDINSAEAAAVTNVNEWTPAKGELSSNVSTPETNAEIEMKDRVSSLPADPMKLEGQESTSGSVDTGSKQVPAALIQILDKLNTPVLYPELTTARSEASLYLTDPVNHHKVMERSVSQAMESSQDKEMLTSQTAPVAQHLLSSDISVSMCVEKAWECFEKGAVERKGITEDTRMAEDTNIGGGKANHEDNIILENNPGIQLFGQTFTFETAVAPFYHQIFERIDTERRDLMNRGIQAQGPAGNWEDGSLRIVTYQSYPRAPSGEASPNICMFEKHVVNDVHHGACKEPFPQDLLNAMNTAKKLIAEVEAAQNTPLTDMTENPFDANISELKILQTVVPTKETHLKNRMSFQPEHSPNNTLSWDEETKHLLDSTSADIEYLPENMSVQSEYSENSQQEPNPVNPVALTEQHNLDSTTAKTSLSIVSKNLPTIDGSVTQISFETKLSTDVAKLQNKDAIALKQTQSVDGTQTLEGDMFTNGILSQQYSSRSLEESHTPVHCTALFPAHMSSNTAPGFRQCDATTLFHSLISEATIQNPNPVNTSLKTSQKAGVQNQITNLTDQSDNMQSYTNDDSRHECRVLESNDGRSDETDACERKTTDSSIYEIKEHKVLDSHRVIDFNVPLDKNNTTSVSNNDNPKHSSTKKVTDIYKDDEQVENLDKSKEQKSSNIKDHHSRQLSEETQEETVVDNQEGEEVEEEEEQQKTPQEEQNPPPHEKDKAEENQRQEGSGKKEHEQPHEKEQEEKQHQQREHGEKEQQEIDETVQLCNKDELGDELHYISNDEAEDEKMQKDTGQNMDECENDDHLSAEVELEKQKAVSGVRSVAIVESNTNDNSFKNEACLDVRQEHQSKYRTLERESEESMGERCSTSGIEDISGETDSSQQDPSQNCNTCSGRDKLLENNLDCIKLIDKELCYQIDKHQPAEVTHSELDLLLENEDLKKQERNSLNEQNEKNMDDGGSTESLTDDDMELYLHSLKNTQQVYG